MRVIIAEDSLIVRTGLERLLANEGHDVVATLSRVEALPAVVDAHAPDIAILDIRMPPTHTDEGLRAGARLRPTHPTLGILVLSQYVVPEYALRLLQTGEAYTGYLLKDRIMDGRSLTDSLERIVAGGTVVDPGLISTLFAAQQRNSPLLQLTDRERQVLQYVAEGLSDRGIGERLTLSVTTVSTHIRHIFRKLRLPDDARANRRVLAAVQYLQGSGSEPEGSSSPSARQ